MTAFADPPFDEPADFRRDFDERLRVEELEPAEASGRPQLPPLQIIRFHKHFGEKIPPRRWIVPDWVPVGEVTSLYGDGGIGKSLLMQQLQTAGAVASDWCGVAVEPVKSLCFYCEDDRDELLRRQELISRFYDAKRDDLQSMAAVSRKNMDNILMTFDSRGRGELTPFYRQVREQALDEKARLLGFDTVGDGFAGNENDIGQVRQYINLAFGSIAAAIDGAVIFSAHPSISGMAAGTGTGGSRAWNNTVRSRLYLTARETDAGELPDDDARILSRKKANYAKRNEQIELRWSNGLFIIDRPKASAFKPPIDDAYLELLDKATAKKENLSASKFSSRNYAPRVFAKRGKPYGYSEKDYEDAQERLLKREKIRIEQYGRTSDERYRIVRA